MCGALPGEIKGECSHKESEPNILNTKDPVPREGKEVISTIQSQNRSSPIPDEKLVTSCGKIPKIKFSPLDIIVELDEVTPQKGVEYSRIQVWKPWPKNGKLSSSPDDIFHSSDEEDR